MRPEPWIRGPLAPLWFPFLPEAVVAGGIFFLAACNANVPSADFSPPQRINISSLPEEVHPQDRADFSRGPYGIEGSVVIIDETTLRFENFSYDGRAPGAYIRLGAAGISPITVGRELPRYDNATFEVMLPSGESTLDYVWVEIWCKPFNTSFAKAVFTSL